MFFLYEIGDAVSERFGFAASRARDDQNRSVDDFDGALLFGIEAGIDGIHVSTVYDCQKLREGPGICYAFRIKKTFVFG